MYKTAVRDASNVKQRLTDTWQAGQAYHKTSGTQQHIPSTAIGNNL